MSNLIRMLAIDPGLHGAIASIAFDKTLYKITYAKVVPFHLFLPLDLNNPKSLQGYITNILCKKGEDIDIHVAIEDVHAFPGQGVSSMFKFGRVHGQIEGMLSTADFDSVTYYSPSMWKKRLMPAFLKSVYVGGVSPKDEITFDMFKIIEFKGDSFLKDMYLEYAKANKQIKSGILDAMMLALSSLYDKFIKE
jgi:hypothetical protein